MTFVYPTFLLALTLGCIPILIYYLIRFRALRVDWGASYVLQRALARMKKKVHLEQLLLLLLRVLAVLALVLLFARPVATRQRTAASGTGVHRIIVLDASYSMLAGSAGATLWDQGLASVRALLGTWGRGERWSLYLLGQPPRWVVDDQAVDTPEKSIAALAGLAPEEGSAVLAQGLATVLQKAGGRPTEVYIVADAQASTWRAVEQLALPNAGNVRFFWLHPPGPGTANLALTRLQLSHERVLLRHPCRAFISVHNYGPAAVDNAEVEVLVDGAFFARTQVTLLPGQEGEASVDLSFDEAGAHAVTARLHPDALDFDNSAAAGVEAVNALSVGVLRDAGKDDKFASSYGLLDLAAKVLTRKGSDDAPLFGGTPFTVRLLAPVPVPTAAALAGVDVVVLDGGCTLTPALVDALRSYVHRGGGLLLAADDTIALPTWNDLLGPAGLLPAPLLALRREALGGERYRSLARNTLEEPALKALATAEDGDLARSRCYAWADLGEPVTGATVLARFGEGQPCAVEQRLAPGMVLLLATGLNSRTNNLLVREFTYPFLLNLLSTAAAGSQPPRTVKTHQALRLPLAATDAAGATAQFTLGQQPPVALALQTAADGALVELADGSDRSGLGTVLLTWPARHRRVFFGVQGERSDSDLRPLEAGERQRVNAHLQLVEASTWPELQALLATGYRGAEWHHWAGLLVLALLLGEMAIQRRFM